MLFYSYSILLVFYSTFIFYLREPEVDDRDRDREELGLSEEADAFASLCCEERVLASKYFSSLPRSSLLSFFNADVINV